MPRYAKRVFITTAPGRLGYSARRVTFKGSRPSCSPFPPRCYALSFAYKAIAFTDAGGQFKWQRSPTEPAVDNFRLSVREGVVRAAALNVSVEVHKAPG